MFSLASVATMAACIFMFGIFYILISNFTAIIKDAEENVGVTVFFDQGVGEEVKDEIMKHCLRSKFDQNPELKAELIKTNGLHLEEANTWGDRYWGTVNGEGKNMLGKLLMELRDEYINSN